MAKFEITTSNTLPVANTDMTTANSTASTSFTPSDVKASTSFTPSTSDPTGGMNFGTANSTDATRNTEVSPTSQPFGKFEGEITESDIPGDLNVASVDELEGNASEVSLPPASTPSNSLSYSPTLTSDTAVQSQILDAQNKIKELERKKEIAIARDELTEQRDDVFDAFGELGDMSEFIADIEEDVELNKRREELTEITNKIRSKELDFRRQIEGIEDLPGMTRAQKVARIADVDRRNSREIADLEIIAMARQGRYNDASAIVDRKVEIEMQARSNQLEGLKFLYLENKERFTTIEQREFERTILNEERAYQSEYDKKKELESLKLQMTINATEAGAGFSELQAIQNASDTTALFGVKNASRYMKSKGELLDERLKEAQLASIYASLSNSSTGTVIGADGNEYTKEDILSAQSKNEVLNQILGQVSKLKTMSGKSGAVGASFNKLFKVFGEGDVFAGSAASGYTEEVNRLVALLSFENLDKLKGSMSDNDLKFLKSIGSSLNLNSNEKAFDVELARIETESVNGYNQTAGVLGVPTWGSLSPEEQAVSMAEQVDAMLKSGSSIYQNSF